MIAVANRFVIPRINATSAPSETRSRAKSSAANSFPVINTPIGKKVGRGLRKDYREYGKHHRQVITRPATGPGPIPHEAKDENHEHGGDEQRQNQGAPLPDGLTTGAQLHPPGQRADQ